MKCENAASEVQILNAPKWLPFSLSNKPNMLFLLSFAWALAIGEQERLPEP